MCLTWRKMTKFGLMGVMSLSVVITLFEVKWSSTQGTRIVTENKLNSRCSFQLSQTPSMEKVLHDIETVIIGRSPCSTRSTSERVHMRRCKAVITSSENNLIPIDVVPQSLETQQDIHGQDLELGGMYIPRRCAPVQRVAIVVPFRDRVDHLKIFLKNIHHFLKKQGVQYMIIVVEQAPGSKFNRGMTRNIGFIEGEKLCVFDCYIFHDIDLIPQLDANAYICDDMPRVHAINLERWNHRIPNKTAFGGVVSIKPNVFRRVNGYSNVYFNWGGEDDDIYRRIRKRGYQVVRYPMNASVYKDLRHPPSVKNPKRHKYLKSGLRRMEVDGLSSLCYKRYLIDFRRLYTWIYVGIDEERVLKDQQKNLDPKPSTSH